MIFRASGEVSGGGVFEQGAGALTPMPDIESWS